MPNAVFQKLRLEQKNNFIMITVKNWEVFKKKQEEFDKLILQSSQLDFKWVSHLNAERLKLALLVEVGEFANEIKSFKIWRKKKEIDLTKAKEELIDCLGYFLGLCNLYQIEMTDNSLIYPSERQDLTEWRKSFKLVQEKFKLDIEKDPKLKNLETSKKFATDFAKGLEEEITQLEKLYQWIYDKEVPFNKLLLEFFYKTNDLLIIDAEIGGKDFYAPEEIKKDKGKTSYYRWLSVFNKICEKLQIDEKELLDIYLEKVRINQQRTKEK